MNAKKPMDTMLYATFTNTTKTYDILDGIHRYTALQIICDTEEFSDRDWILESTIFFNVRFNATEEELIGLFKSLNKGMPVPDLYLRDYAKERREAIEQVAAAWQRNYKLCFSTNVRPQRPNTNRDRFIELLDGLYGHYNFRENGADRLERCLARINQIIAENPPKKLSASIRQKCDATGCWLFLYSNEELLQM